MTLCRWQARRVRGPLGTHGWLPLPLCGRVLGAALIRPALSEEGDHVMPLVKFAHVPRPLIFSQAHTPDASACSCLQSPLCHA